MTLHCVCATGRALIHRKPPEWFVLDTAAFVLEGRRPAYQTHGCRRSPAEGGARPGGRLADFVKTVQLFQFSRPSGVFIDKNDTIYVADSESESVSKNHDGWKRGIRIGKVADGVLTAFIPDPAEKVTGSLGASQPTRWAAFLARKSVRSG